MTQGQIAYQNLQQFCDIIHSRNHPIYHIFFHFEDKK